MIIIWHSALVAWICLVSPPATASNTAVAAVALTAVDAVAVDAVDAPRSAARAGAALGATGVTKLCAARRAAAPAALRVSADDMARTWETGQTALKNELRHGNLRKPSQFSHYLRHLVSQERSQERHLTGSLDMTLNAPPFQDSRLRPKRWPVQPRSSFHVM